MKVKLIILFAFSVNLTFGQTYNYDSIIGLCNQGKFNEAIEQSSLAIQNLTPSDTLLKNMLRLRVSCFMATSDYNSAIKDFNSLLETDANNVQYYVGLSFAYWALNDNINCMNSINKAYEINPKDIGILNNMSYFYGQAGRYNESIRYANEGLDQSKGQNTLKDAFYNNRGFAHLGLKQYDLAIDDINQAISINSQNSFAYFYRALVNIELQKMEKVCQDLEKSKSLGGNNLTVDLIAKYCEQ